MEKYRGSGVKVQKKLWKWKLIEYRVQAGVWTPFRGYVCLAVMLLKFPLALALSRLFSALQVGNVSGVERTLLKRLWTEPLKLLGHQLKGGATIPWWTNWLIKSELVAISCVNNQWIVCRFLKQKCKKFAASSSLNGRIYSSVSMMHVLKCRFP